MGQGYASGSNNENFGVQGKKVEFPKWNKPLYRESSHDGSNRGPNVPSRLPKVGKGFSKVLMSASPVGVKTIG